MNWKGIDLTQLIAGIIAIIGALLARAQTKIAEGNAERNAWARLAVIGLAMANDLWESLTITYQQDMVDGKLDRELYTKILGDKLEKYTSKEELEKIAKAVKLPVPGILAWLAEYIIDRILAAHNPANAGVSAKQYPVTSEGDDEVDAYLNTLRTSGG